MSSRSLIFKFCNRNIFWHAFYHNTIRYINIRYNSYLVYLSEILIFVSKFLEILEELSNSSLG